jgi:cytochrome P450
MSAPLKSIPKVPAPWLLGSWTEFQTDRLGLLLRVARECGGIGQFRVGPMPFVLVNDVNLLAEMLIDRASEFNTSTFAKSFEPVLGVNALVGISGEQHRRIRKIMAPAFQLKRLMSYTGFMVECADKIQSSIQDGDEVDIVGLTHRLIRDVLVRSLFSIDMTESDTFFESVHTVAEYIGHRVANPLMLPLVVPTEYNKRVRGAISLLRGRARQLMVDGQQRGDKGDVLSMLILSKDENGQGMSEDELVDQILTLYMAGLETTANGLSFLWMNLATNPEVQARLHAEVDSVLGGRAPVYQDLAKLPFTLQVVKESFRLYPPAFMYGRSPNEDMELGGYPIPKGRFILISPYVLHRNPEYFPEPERFVPERFAPESEKKLPRCAYIPFGTGPRVCVGQHFAMMETHMMLAHMCQFLSVSLPSNQHVRSLPLATLTPSPFRIKVTRRKQAVALAS